MRKEFIKSMLQRYTNTVKMWKRDIICITFLFLSSCIFFRQVLLRDYQLLFLYDTVYQVYPWNFFAESMLNDNQFPLWNPYSAGGEPFIANIHAASFYPPNFILLSIFPAHLALGYSYLLHIFFAGLFMYLFMKYLTSNQVCSFLSSIIFMYSGYFFANVISGHHAQISTACWIPLIFLLFTMALRQASVFYGMLTGISIGLQFLAGHPQISFYTLIALGLYLVFRSYLIIQKKRAFKEVAQLFAISALAIGVGVLLAAIQLLPTFEFVDISTREGRDYEYATLFSFPRRNLITFVLPNFYGNVNKYLGIGNYSEFYVYLGILPLILIFFAIFFKRDEKEEREYILFFTGLAALSMFLAFGRYTRIYWYVWKYVPFFDLFRMPAKFKFLFTFSVSILAGFGFRFLQGELTSRAQKKVWQSIKALVLLITLMVCELIVFKDEFTDFGNLRDGLKLFITIITRPVYSIRYYESHKSFPLIIDWLLLLALLICSVALLTLRVIPNNHFKFKHITRVGFLRVSKNIRKGA